MDKKKREVKLPNYVKNEELAEQVNEKEKLDELWDGESIDEEKD